MKTGMRCGYWSSPEELAQLLLRLLGIFFLALAVESGITEASRISIVSKRFGWDEFLWWTVAIGSTRLVAELIVGGYLVLGGKWIFGRILAPIAHRPKPNVPADGS